jgi:CCR4-NOT complex subunit CAF16
MNSSEQTTTAAAVHVANLNFSYGGPPILSNVNLELPKGSRCLLVGCNGVGKSTLLRILAGKRMVSNCKVLVLGKDAYRETSPNLTYLGAGKFLIHISMCCCCS